MCREYTFKATEDEILVLTNKIAAIANAPIASCRGSFASRERSLIDLKEEIKRIAKREFDEWHLAECLLTAMRDSGEEWRAYQLANRRKWKLRHEQGEFSYAEFWKDVQEWCIAEMPQVEKLHKKRNSGEDTAYHVQDNCTTRIWLNNPYKRKGEKYCNHH